VCVVCLNFVGDYHILLSRSQFQAPARAVQLKRLGFMYITRSLLATSEEPVSVMSTMPPMPGKLAFTCTSDALQPFRCTAANTQIRGDPQAGHVAAFVGTVSKLSPVSSKSHLSSAVAELHLPDGDVSVLKEPAPRLECSGSTSTFSSNLVDAKTQG
jgi:hypothetical protein